MQHIAQHGSGVCHCIGTVGDDDSVVIVEGCVHLPRDQLPLLRLDVGAVQVKKITPLDLVVLAQVRHVAQQLLRGQRGNEALVAGSGGNGSACGEQQYFFHTIRPE
ncbi:hypothetical protein SDC9_131421 [bioreactor metagenome]|uniref:Uncharacterized protein n=1 Tax=bioreactor metagenome TaxID=1076179 RepID=A0A645D4D8_9ZZZZ